MAFYEDPTFFALIAFILFFVVVWVKARAAITSGLDSKIDAIRKEIEDARQLHEDARATLADYQKKHNNAVKEAEDIVAHAEEEAKRIVSSAGEETEALLKRRMTAAEERIANAESAALAEVKAVAVEAAIAASKSLIAENLDDHRQSALVDATLQGLADKVAPTAH